jgi:hypothetical protein
VAGSRATVKRKLAHGVANRRQADEAIKLMRFWVRRNAQAYYLSASRLETTYDDASGRTVLSFTLSERPKRPLSQRTP